MPSENAEDGLDRHALVLAIWLVAGFVALVLLHYGMAAGGLPWLAGGFAALLAGFGGHVIVNAVLGTGFTPREVGLGMVVWLAGWLALVLAILLVDGFAGQYLLPVAGGMILLALAVVVTLVTRLGLRGAFDVFDVIRDNNPRRASRLRHRGGRK